MATNHGKLVFRELLIEGRRYGQPIHVNSGQPWKDVAAETPGHWFIVVVEDGTIVSAEPDPMQSMIVDRDIWEIEHAGPADDIRGKYWDGTKITTPPIEQVRAQMPSLSTRQIRLGLANIGITEAQVDAALADDPLGLIEWKHATSFSRLHPLIDSLGAAFTLTPEQIDTLWLWAHDL